MTIDMESRRISWNLVEGSCQNRPITLKVGFLLESASLTMRC